MTETRPTTIADVAALAGVSIGTVSKALNGRGQLRPETRDRVLAAAEQLGFRPSPLARGLLSGRSYTVGLITTDSFGRFTIPVMLGAEDALGQGQMSVLLCDGRGDPIREQHYVRTLLSRKVDGIIVTGRRTDPRPPIASGLPVPVVYVMTQSEGPGELSLIPDDRQGGELAARHLVTSGRASIAHVTGPERFLSARLRAEGMRKTLSESGLSLAAGQVMYGEWSEAWGRHAAHAVLRAEPGTDAIFCGSDQIARGVSDALRESGRRIPDDIALVGYDNWDVFAQTSRPPLTTVDMCLEELGRAAARRLLDAIAERSSHGLEQLPCRLVIRESSGVGPPALPPLTRLTSLRGMLLVFGGDRRLGWLRRHSRLGCLLSRAAPPSRDDRGCLGGQGHAHHRREQHHAHRRGPVGRDIAQRERGENREGGRARRQPGGQPGPPGEPDAVLGRTGVQRNPRVGRQHGNRVPGRRDHARQQHGADH